MWRIDTNADDELVLSGPVGDTLVLALNPDPHNPDEGINWTGWTWTGGITEERGGPVVHPFDFEDLSTATQLNVVASVDETITADWTPGTTLYFGIRGSKDGDLLTFGSGLVQPEQGVLPNE